MRWLLLENASSRLLEPGEQIVADAAAAVKYNPDAIFAPGDRIPGESAEQTQAVEFVTGLK